MSHRFIDNYFSGEKKESVWIFLIGMAAMLAGMVCLLFMPGSFCKGLSVPLLAVSVIQITVGITIYCRTPGDVKRVKSFFEEKEKFQLTEIPRMEKVMRSFIIYKWVEILLMGTGIILVLASTESFLAGMGVGLLVQSSLMLAADMLAQRRGRKYLSGLQTVVAEFKK
jgi:archaellum biogenesis protein FlaJ (TadC family)